MRIRDLTGIVLQNVGKRSLQHARGAAAKTCSMFAQQFAAAAGFHADEFYPFVFYEVVKNTDGVRSATDTGDDRCRQPAFSLQNLGTSFASDDYLKITHHSGIRMRA